MGNLSKLKAHHQWISINTLSPRQNGRCFADDTFKRIFLNENVRISIKFSLKFVPKGPINNIPALVQIMAWRRLGDKPLSEPVMTSLLTHVCVTRPQWVHIFPYNLFRSKWFGFKFRICVAKFVLRATVATYILISKRYPSHVSHV